MNVLRVSLGLVCLVFFISFVVSVESTIECPEVMHLDEEAVCTIDVTDVTDVYDVKIYVVGDKGGVNQILDGETFRRADWYVKEIVTKEGEYDIKIKIHKAFDGKANVQFKLRDSSGKIVLYQEFDMEISSDSLSSNQEEEEDIATVQEEMPTVQEEDGTSVQEKTQKQVVSEETHSNESVQEQERGTQTKNVSKTIINLGGYEASEETVVYTSKMQRIKDYFVYFFVFFLIVIVCFLLYERYDGNRDRDY